MHTSSLKRFAQRLTKSLRSRGAGNISLGMVRDVLSELLMGMDYKSFLANQSPQLKECTEQSRIVIKTDEKSIVIFSNNPRIDCKVLTCSTADHDDYGEEDLGQLVKIFETHWQKTNDHPIASSFALPISSNKGNNMKKNPNNNKAQNKKNSFSIADESMAKKCLECGGETRSDTDKPSLYVCTTCGTAYYRNYCWNCKKVVDSRDTENNPRCSNCGWYKCTCGACHQGGCRTNPYRKEISAKDQKIMEEILRQIAEEEAAQEAEMREIMRQADEEEAAQEAEMREIMRQADEEEAAQEAEMREIMRQADEEEAALEAEMREIMR